MLLTNWYGGTLRITDSSSSLRSPTSTTADYCLKTALLHKCLRPPEPGVKTPVYPKKAPPGLRDPQCRRYFLRIARPFKAGSGISRPGRQFMQQSPLKLQMDMVAPELGQVMAFYKSSGGYVSASVDGVGDVIAQVVHEADLNTDTLRTILEYLRSKAA